MRVRTAVIGGKMLSREERQQRRADRQEERRERAWNWVEDRLGKIIELLT